MHKKEPVILPSQRLDFPTLTHESVKVLKTIQGMLEDESENKTQGNPHYTFEGWMDHTSFRNASCMGQELLFKTLI